MATRTKQQTATTTKRSQPKRAENMKKTTAKTAKTTGRAVREHKTALILAGTALAAGFTAYYLSGDEGRKRRLKAKEWMLDAKNEIAHRIEKTGDVTREKYYEIVDSVTESYRGASSERKEYEGFRKDLTTFWDNYADVIDDAKAAGKDIMVMIAEKIRDADSPKDAARDIRTSLKENTKEALRGAAHGSEKHIKSERETNKATKTTKK